MKIFSKEIGTHKKQGAAHYHSADRVFTNAKIYTVTPEQHWAEAVAIKDGSFVYVGDNPGAKQWIGPETEEIDLEGKLVLPGLIDSHVHPGLVAGTVELITMPFTEVYPLPYTCRKEVLTWLRKFAKKNPELP